MGEHRRMTFSLSSEVIEIINSLAPENKSSFVEKAVTEYGRSIKQEQLHRRLKEGYQANADSDREVAAAFFPLEQEAYDRQVLKGEA